MLPPEKPEFLKILNGLASIKPGAKLSPEGLSVWWLALREWTLEEFRAAASHLAKSVEFMPSPFHFERLRYATRPTAGEAFAKAVKHAASSAYREGMLGEPVTDAAVSALGGYRVIAMCDVDKLPFLERRFCEHYEAIQDAQEVRDELPMLKGPSRRTTGQKALEKLQ